MLKLTKNALGETVVQAYLNDAGELEKNLICEVGCGKCCGDWHLIPEFTSVCSASVKCPHLKSSGCRLKRTRRPAICNAYLCELGFLKNQGMVTDEEIQRVVLERKQEDAILFLNKKISVPTYDQIPPNFSYNSVVQKYRNT